MTEVDLVTRALVALRDHLNLGGEWILVRPRRYLGSENFAKIASIIKECGGEYVSAGKQSRFRIPRRAGE